MSPELEKKLIDKYPEIFTRKDETGESKVVSYGIDVGDGWYDIIDAACVNIMSHMEHHRGKRHLTPEEFEETVQVKAAQVKEKFGGLRFYVDNHNEYVSGILAMAESMSMRTCERCGNPGTQRKGGWIKTLCQTCDSGARKK
jgi:hypothetical protein